MRQDRGHCLLFSFGGVMRSQVAFRIMIIKLKLQAKEEVRAGSQVNKLEPDEWWGNAARGSEASPTNQSQAAESQSGRQTLACPAQGWEHHKLESERGRAGQGLASILKHSVGSKRLLGYQDADLLVLWCPYILC